ncbi:hypothetical protein NEOLEDRAFT_1183797 [Neolentinus lepideus HHB14362 ss-1]|uniref:Uncharacterized protein n=1 Tax=Neolentinus lepideus HHB14362 ss-1 TaxID=1314782 RepID=A0A165MZQ4_9AGAM|nr:hypothetical protein NEOLEDRAFT_1183797 [Neolentinus lepideus HHB14362 ss-1]
MSLPTRKMGNSTATAIGYGSLGITAKPTPMKFLDTLYESECTNWDNRSGTPDECFLCGEPEYIKECIKTSLKTL